MFRSSRKQPSFIKLSRQALFGLLSFVIVLAGCNSTNRGNASNAPLLVGPSPIEEQTSANNANSQLKNAELFLDVAIPVFAPGLPLDSYGEIDGELLEKEGIWPQLRRTEAKLFAAEMKNALDNEQVFGSVSVVPDASTPSDLFVLGEILKSDSEEVEIEIMVLNSTGEIMGKKKFDHTVSVGFMRDQLNKGRNPYQPVFNKASDYVVSLLSELTEQEKTYIKNMSLMRYARYYSPESYDQYISTEVKRKNGQSYYQFELTGLPDENDPMLSRIENLRAQELLFVDRLQDNYDVFQAQTKTAYLTWQEETLPEILAAREARAKRNTQALLGVGAAILTAVLIKKASDRIDRGRDNSDLNIGAVAAGIGSIYAINEAFKSNARLKVHSDVIDEQGQALDLSVSPTVIEFEDQTLELKGTAQEQYLQWKTHLRNIFKEEETPNIQL